VSSLDYLAIALGAVALAFVVFVLVPMALLFGLRDSLEQRIKHRYSDPDALVSVNYEVSSFGVRARGLGQWKGNGALAVTRDELRFFQFLPQRELSLKLARVTGLRLVRSHLGKATTSELLRVEFSTERGPGAVAFWLREPAKLKATLETLTNLGGAG
jgi:hypothetical protein